MSTAAAPHNVLVLSDLHLGEDLAPTATEATRLHVDIVERQLCQFLRHYTRRREQGRPWRLVFNGDLIDFLAIAIGPDHPDFALLSAPAFPDEHKYGLRRTAKTAVTAIDSVARRHIEVFRALARFLARGNRLEIICGNHDVELTWPAVQAAFRGAVARAWSQLSDSTRQGAPSGDDLVSGIGFHPWFFFEKGSIWIEHGHQYDECCSFEHQLDPRRPGGDDIVMNVDNASLRYIANRVRETDRHGQDGWSAYGYLRFGASLGVRGFSRILLAYAMFLVAMLAAWRHGRASRRSMAERTACHVTRVRQLAERWSVDAETLLALDGERRPPVVAHLRRLASIMMLDRAVLYSAAIAAGVAAFVTLTMTVALAVGVGAMVAAMLAVRVTSRDRSVDPQSIMAAQSARILERVDARFVVFGHTHEPVAQPVGAAGKMYFNTGTWVPSGRPGILRSFTHLVVRHRESGPTAELCQWRDGMSRPFTPGWRPASSSAPRAGTVGVVVAPVIPVGPALTDSQPAGAPASARSARGG